MRVATEHPDVILRPWVLEDVPALVRNGNNRAVWRNLTDMFPSPYTEGDAKVWVAFANVPSRSTHFTIEVEGVSAGGIGIMACEGVARRTGHIGYWLGEPYWGRGIASVAVRAMVRFAAEHLEFARLEAPVFAWNPASMRVLEKSGFIREGVLARSVFKDGELIDSVMYARLIDRVVYGTT